MSEALSLTCGVPQGSILGPTLFLVYVNDISNTLSHVKHMLYADDTVLYTSSKEMALIETRLQDDLNKFCKWCSQNALTINVKKNKYVVYGTSQKLKNVRGPNIRLNNSILTREHVYRYLGIYLDSTLNFNKHIDYVNKIVSHKIYTLSKIRCFIDKSTALHIYKSMIAPILDYGNIIYAGGTQNKLEKLKRTQNRGLRTCLGICGRIGTLDLHRIAQVPQLHI